MIELFYNFAGIAFLMLVPGYCFTLAAFPLKKELSALERFAFALFFSIIIPSLVLAFAYSFFNFAASFLAVGIVSLAVIIASMIVYFSRSRAFGIKEKAFF